MLKKLSRIFGIAGSALALLTFLYAVISAVYSPYTAKIFGPLDLFRSIFSAIAAVLIFFAAAGFAGSFLVRKKPVLAAVLMIVSGTFVFPCCFFALAVLPMFTGWIALIPWLLLITAGVLALFDNKSFSGAHPVLKKLSLIAGMIGAALNMLVWAYNAGYEMYYFCLYKNNPSVMIYVTPLNSLLALSALLASAAGLWGSLLLLTPIAASRERRTKGPMIGAIMMLASGVLVYYIMFSYYSGMIPYWWFGVVPLPFIPLPLIAAGVLALIGSVKIPGQGASGTEVTD